MKSSHACERIAQRGSLRYAEKRRCDEVMTEALREYKTKGNHKAMTPED